MPLGITPLTLRVKADPLPRRMRVRTMYVPQRVGVLLEVLMAGPPWRSGEECRETEAEQEELDEEDGDGGVEGEALGEDALASWMEVLTGDAKGLAEREGGTWQVGGAYSVLAERLEGYGCRIAHGDVGVAPAAGPGLEGVGRWGALVEGSRESDGDNGHESAEKTRDEDDTISRQLSNVSQHLPPRRLFTHRSSIGNPTPTHLSSEQTPHHNRIEHYHRGTRPHQRLQLPQIKMVWPRREKPRIRAVVGRENVV